MSGSAQRIARPSVQPLRDWRLAQPVSMTLDNGLAVLAYQRDGQHIISAELVLDIPSACEPTDYEGIGEQVALNISEGTLSHPGNSFADAVESLGAILDATAGHSATQVGLDVPAPKFPEALQLLAESVLEPTLDDADVDRSVALRLAEIAQEMANPSSLAALGFREAVISGDFRASRPVGGKIATVEKLNGELVRSFHHQQYRLNGATLIVVGDFISDPFSDVAAAFNTAAVPKNGATHQTPFPCPPRAVLIDRPGAVQAEVRLGGFSVDRRNPDYVHLQMGCWAMGGTFLSRLNKVLREERGYTYGAHLISRALRSGGLINLQGSFRTEVTLAALEEAREILDLTNKPITELEVESAVANAQGSFPLALSTASQVAGYTASLVQAGLELDYSDQFLDSLRSVTPESATAALIKYLPLDALTLVVVGCAESLADGLNAAGWAVETI